MFCFRDVFDLNVPETKNGEKKINLKYTEMCYIRKIYVNEWSNQTEHWYHGQYYHKQKKQSTLLNYKLTRSINIQTIVNIKYK